MNNFSDIDLTIIKSFDNWEKVTAGLFCFTINRYLQFEIHINAYVFDTPILTANADLFLAGSTHDKGGVEYFYRELI